VAVFPAASPATRICRLHDVKETHFEPITGISGDVKWTDELVELRGEAAYSGPFEREKTLSNAAVSRI
jgi:hypothetical protein